MNFVWKIWLHEFAEFVQQNLKICIFVIQKFSAMKNNCLTLKTFCAEKVLCRCQQSFSLYKNKTARILNIRVVFGGYILNFDVLPFPFLEPYQQQYYSENYVKSKCIPTAHKPKAQMHGKEKSNCITYDPNANKCWKHGIFCVSSSLKRACHHLLKRWKWLDKCQKP